MPEPAKPNIGAILLAAGNSSRMGRPKQQLTVNNQPLLRRTTQIISVVGLDEVLIVLGAFADQHRELVHGLDVEVIENAAWAQGMGGSLKHGLKALLAHKPDLDAVIISVCDQPYLSVEVFHQLINKYQERNCKIVASAYAGINGVPTLFDQRLFDQLLGIDDGAGAKRIIKQFSNLVETVPFELGKMDLDTPEDYDEWLKGQGSER
ncbi:MAG: nucleotidyltransferase family protein [Bacteroidota bacterium]